LKNITAVVGKFVIWTDRQGQDLVEYALLAGFMALAAGAIIPSVANDISQILGKIPGMMPWTETHGSVI
jgi:Flp pilus assembly pilin Flp